MNIFGEAYTLKLNRQKKTKFLMLLKKHSISFNRWNQRIKMMPIEEIEVGVFLLLIDALDIGIENMPVKFSPLGRLGRASKKKNKVKPSDMGIRKATKKTNI